MHFLIPLSGLWGTFALAHGATLLRGDKNPGEHQSRNLQDASIYESFGGTSSGFKSGSSWNADALDGVFDIKQAEGLQYTDGNSHKLLTAGGSLSVSMNNGLINLKVKRTMEAPLGGTYWVSYLMRLDSSRAGDAFWTPDGSSDVGAGGFQGNNSPLRLVNGPTSNVNANQGQTYFLVLQVEENSASMWVNPDLANPGQPLAIRADAASTSSNDCIFKFNNINNGEYTIDELHIGASFADVTPWEVTTEEVPPTTLAEPNYPAHCQQALQEWLPEPDKVDFMAITCHPDDEGIFFGGALPYYSQVREKKTFVVGMNGNTNNHRGLDRKEELERAAWHYGVRYQPVNLGYSDVNSNVPNSWDPQNGLDGIARRVAGVIRRYKPDVVITHDLGGEYGHAAHRATAEAVSLAYGLAADPTLNIDGLPVWQVKKMYLHLYMSPRGRDRVPAPQVTSAGFLYHSWEAKYAALGGKSSRDVANEALLCHQDAVLGLGGTFQVVSRAVDGELFDGNPSEDWGLWGTAVGPDTVPSDFFQNIPDQNIQTPDPIPEPPNEVTDPPDEITDPPNEVTDPPMVTTQQPPQVERVYESFGDTSSGFQSGSSWNADALDGVFDINQAEGLQYADGNSRTLLTAGGSLSVSMNNGVTNLKVRRALEAPLSGTYWVSYLIRLDSPRAGDAFWTPDGLFDIGAGGFQGNNSPLRLVNGPTSNVNANQGQTYFLVLQVEENSASMWVNPDLVNRGQPLAIRADTEPRASNDCIFKFNSINNGEYTIDELRIGSSFADVTPWKSPNDVEPPLEVTDPPIVVTEPVTEPPPEVTDPPIVVTEPVTVPPPPPPVDDGMWEFSDIESLFVGSKLKRCSRKNNVAPQDGTKCSAKIKTCFFGNQACSAVQWFPDRRCFCDGAKGDQIWNCADVACPTSATDSIQ